MKTKTKIDSESVFETAMKKELLRKIWLSNLLGYISCVTFTGMGTISWMQGNYMLASADMFGVFSVVGIIVWNKVSGNNQIGIYFGAGFFAVFCLYLFVTGGVGKSAFVWFYVYPLVSAFLLGAKRGAQLALFILALALIYVLTSYSHTAFFVSYSTNLMIRFFPSMLAVIFFSYLAERTRERSYAELAIMTEKLSEEKQKAERATLIKSEFLANMSHEIRTPMTSIVGMNALALKTELTEYQSNLLNAVKKSSDSLLVILNDILDFSKIEAGQLEFDLHPFSVHDLLGSIQEIMLVAAQEKGLRLEVGSVENIPDIFIGDELRLRQILMNLLNNAIKFTQQGTISIKVSLDDSKPEPGTRGLRFSVADTGIGIPPEKQVAVFNSFTQSDSSTARQYGGTGLGLAISKQLIEKMGGQIWLESTVGIGSTFYFTINLPEDTAIPVTDKIPLNPAQLQPLDILLVEDNLLNQELGKIILANEGHNVAVTADGLECLEFLLKFEYDVVLMDVQMPNMDGLTATRVIRACETNTCSGIEIPAKLAVELTGRLRDKHLPIVAMTANAMKGDREECLAVGMDDYLTKPFQPEQIFATLYRVMEKSISD